MLARSQSRFFTVSERRVPDVQSLPDGARVSDILAYVRVLNDRIDAMTERYRVRLDKKYHVFSAGHFITYGGDICERLHGHNYRVQVEVDGPLDENHYVVDFISLRDALKTITDELDHRMMLPTEHRAIRVQADEREVTVTFEDRRWVFPRCDCVLLPLPNTTAELLARHIGRRLLESLQTQSGVRPERLQVAVGEDNGQWGIWEGMKDEG